MAEVFISVIRTDIPDGAMQVLDLQPNTSLRTIYDPPSQTKYLRRLDNDTVSTQTAGGIITTFAPLTGLAAYLIDNVEAGGVGGAHAPFTAAQANAAATAIIAAMDAGTAMGLAAVNVLLSAVVAQTELTSAGSLSTGTMAGLLAILAGGYYTLPAGSIISTAGVFTVTASGSLDTTKYRPTYDTGAFQLSLNMAEGDLFQLSSANYSYRGTTGAAVVVYDAAGAVL